jgi:lipopolysaccharide export system permease protein
LGRTLERYILREVVLSWLAVTGVLLVILVINEVAHVLSRAADNQYPRSMVLELIGLGALHNLDILVPIGLLLGVVLALGRLYHDSEVAAALACGAGPGRIYVPVSLLAVIVMALLVWLSLVVAPRAMARVLDLRRIAFEAGRLAPIAPGRFHTYGGGATVVYAERANPDGTLANVFVEHNRGERVEVALAERARHAIAPDGRSLTITLYHGERFEGRPGGTEFRIMRFAEHTIPVELPPPAQTTVDVDSTPTAVLLRSHDRERQAELQWRLALPVMAVVLTLLAVPLSRLNPRQGRYARVWLAVLLYLVYSNLVTLGRSWIERGMLPASYGLWWTHAAVIAAALLTLGAPMLLARIRHKEAAA